MKTIIFTVLTILLSLSVLQAQSFKDKAFHGIGYNFGLGLMPAFSPDDKPGSADQYTCLIMGLQYNFRYNLHELNDNHSIGAGVIPALGIDYGTSESQDIIGFGGFNLPLELSYNLGAGATYNSTANHGFAIKTGIDLSFMPLLAADEDSGTKENFKRFYAGPHVGISFRFWKKSSSLREFFMRYTFLKHKVEIDPEDDFPGPFLVRIGFRNFFGY